MSTTQRRIELSHQLLDNAERIVYGMIAGVVPINGPVYALHKALCDVAVITNQKKKFTHEPLTERLDPWKPESEDNQLGFTKRNQSYVSLIVELLKKRLEVRIATDESLAALFDVPSWFCFATIHNELEWLITKWEELDKQKLAPGFEKPPQS